jgi:peptidyl-prolyl cis-trans isomerase D
MLTTLRNKTAGIIMKVILGLIVISFAVWGVHDVFRPRASTTVASVGDIDIGIESFRERFRRELQRAGSRFGRPLTPADARAIGLDRQVLGELMAEATLQEQAKRMNLGIPQTAVADAIMADDAFRGPNGAFDPNRFDQVLRANDLNEPMYVALQRRMLLRRQIIDGLVGGIDSPDVLTQAVYRHQNERRSASYVLLPGSDGAGIAAPGDDVLKSFYEERKGTFQAPETRSATVVAATADALAAKETVSDEDVQARYEQEKAKYGTPERRTVERITFPTLAEAKQASDKIKGGTTFEEIAKAQNETEADLSLGTVAKTEILDMPIADAAFALPQGQVSEPVEGQFATVLLRVTAIEPGVEKTFDDVKEQVRSEIARQRAEDKLLTLHDQIEDDRASGMTLAEVAAKNGLDVRTVEKIDRQGRVGKEPANIPGGATVLSEIYQSDVGVENNPVQIDGGYVWFDVTEVDPARERTFDEAKDDVLARWRAEEARKALDAKTADTLKALQDGSLKLADFASRESLQVQTAEKLDRRGGDLGSSAAAQIFSTPQGTFGSAPSQNDGRILFEVTAIQTPALDLTTKDSKELADRIAATVENDLAAQYVLQLQKDFGTTVNTQALASALGIQSGQP